MLAISSSRDKEGKWKGIRKERGEKNGRKIKKEEGESKGEKEEGMEGEK